VPDYEKYQVALCRIGESECSAGIALFVWLEIPVAPLADVYPQLLRVNLKINWATKKP